MPDDRQLARADRQARDDALDVSRSFIVQAPAGSGKTELLIQRYLKLLAIVDQPEEVLAITFTRKAALEMQLRVISALRLAASGREPAASHERITFAAASAVLAHDARLDWQLLDSPGRMRIQTVDAFCSGIARTLPVSSGLGGIGSTLADAGMTTIYRQAAAATLESLDAGDGMAASIEQLVTHLDNHTWTYIAYLSRMLQSRDQWLPLTGSGLGDDDKAADVRASLEQNIANMIVRQLQNLCALAPERCRETLPGLLVYARGKLRESGADQSLARINTTDRLPGCEVGDREDWQAIAGLLLRQDGAWRKTVNRNDGFPPGDGGQKQQMLALLECLPEFPEFRDALRAVRVLPQHRYSDPQWDVLRALLKVLPLAYAELKQLFAARGVSDHTEVALAARKALGSADDPGDIALWLDYRIRHLLVDEMQDTSLSQYGLLAQLTSGWTPGDGRTLFCVGDPMQSIYRFRDAEVGQFLLARQDGIGDVTLQPLVLRRNFRSGENLVHWFNTVFSQVLPVEDNIAAGAISYSASAPVEAHASVGDIQIHALFDATPEEEARHGLKLIRDCLDANPGEDVALLVRSRTRLPVLLYELRRAGIPYRALEIDRLTDLPEMTDLLALTRALCHEGDRLAWLALLRGPWVGLTWRDLHRLVRNDAHSTIPELLQDVSRVELLSEIAQSRVARFMQRIRPYVAGDLTRSLRDSVELAWFALGGPLMLQDRDQCNNVYRFFQVLEKIEIAGSLDDVRDLERLLDDERISSRSEPGCALQVMTMHKAKGLQFDHVVLYGLGRLARGREKSVLGWLSTPGSRGSSEIIISPVGPRSEVENDPLHRYIESSQREKERLELDRLLYVSCTRARKSLHLVGSVRVADDGQSFKRPDARSLLYRLWDVLEPVYERAFADSGIAEQAAGYDAGDAHLVDPVLRRLERAPPSEPRTLPKPPRPAAKPSTEAQVEYYWVGTGARHAGTIVHRWLQRAADGLVELNVDNIRSLRDINRAWARRLGVADDDLDAVCGRAEEALINLADDETGRWILDGEGRSELPISGVLDGHIQSIIIDRVRVDENGVHWIVDYKTSTHEGGDLEGFLQQERDRYRPQLEKYAGLYAQFTNAPLRTALYFPLLQRFVELH